MHPPHVRAKALELIAAGHNDCEVSRRLAPAIPRNPCPRCWRAAKPMHFTPEDYCELLGLYLGDGCLSEHARAVRLRITLDAKYPQIIREARELVQRCLVTSVEVV